MKKSRLWSIGLAFLLVSSAIAEGNKFWIDLEHKQTFHYGSIPISAVQGDLDNDGVMDVAVGTYGVTGVEHGICYILWGGTLYDEIGATMENSFQLITILDIDNNGYKDIICVSGVFYNQGNREFVFDKSTRFSLSSKFADINNDKKVDIVTGGYWRNGSDGTQQDFNIQMKYFELIDMNNDGRLDIIGNKDHEYISLWFENTDKEESFSDAAIIDNVNVIPYKVMDYDYDGDDDLLVQREGIIRFLVNDNGLLPLNFNPLFETIPEGFKSTRMIADLDFDGDWDMFGYNGTERRFFVVEQVGYRTLQFEFHWISDKVTLSSWRGFLIYENNGQLYYYFEIISGVGPSAMGGIYRTPVNVQAGNAVSMNWEIFE